ncbi:arylamine N-acetyltransferase [Amorphus sp. 3PC139-8]|uniref:arylamine N-acetyltransferase family protein n=1 Tax=Amorphus sp. 3PC139-8 TaxID=2735676 RepID=UPI00345CFEC5
MVFQVSAYLKRIGVSNLAPDLDGLTRLQLAQMRAMPFESIDPFLGVIPDLSPEGLWRKLVVSGRGGYCFELNTLFGHALANLGFQARPILGRVRMRSPTGGPRAHLAHLVTIDGVDYLADAGFGGPAAIAPLRLETDRDQSAPNGRYRFRAEDASGDLLLERWTDTGWFPLHVITEQPFSAIDIEAANFLCARWSEMPFPSNLMVSRQLSDGQATLMNRAATVTTSEGTRTWTVADEAELDRLLNQTFGISADRPMVAAIWRRISSMDAS